VRGLSGNRQSYHDGEMTCSIGVFRRHIILKKYCFLILAVLPLLMLLILFLLIHGSYSTMIWLTSKPFPFRTMGSGPFQLWTGVLMIILSGLFFSLYRFVSRNKEKDD